MMKPTSVSTYLRIERKEIIVFFGAKKLSIMDITHDSLYALLKGKDIAAYLLHAQSVRKRDIAGVANEEIVHEEPNSIEDKSVQGE
jgi:hypothetical protein